MVTPSPERVLTHGQHVRDPSDSSEGSTEPGKSCVTGFHSCLHERQTLCFNTPFEQILFCMTSVALSYVRMTSNKQKNRKNPFQEIVMI